MKTIDRTLDDIDTHRQSVRAQIPLKVLYDTACGCICVTHTSNMFKLEIIDSFIFQLSRTRTRPHMSATVYQYMKTYFELSALKGVGGTYNCCVLEWTWSPATFTNTDVIFVSVYVCIPVSKYHNALAFEHMRQTVHK